MDSEDPTRYYGLLIGVVVDRKDPDGLGRVRVRVPGFYEPMSGWARALGMPAAGGMKRGTFAVPPEGAEVGILCVQGDPDEPRYLPGSYGRPGGQSEVPGDANGDPDVTVTETAEYLVVVDDRDPPSLTLLHKASGDRIRMDGAERSIFVEATTRLVLTAKGQVEISGLLVTVNDVAAGMGKL